jgi:hypothetical protein
VEEVLVFSLMAIALILPIKSFFRRQVGVPKREPVAKWGSRMVSKKMGGYSPPVLDLKLTSQHLHAFHVNRIPLDMTGDCDVMAFMAF